VTDVSRETPPAPDPARGVFPSDRWALVERYVALLATAGVERGLIGPREVPRLWERHVLNCAVVTECLPPEARNVADIGSGAGLPGLPLALARPDLQVTLVEPLLRRTAFLDEVVADLGLSGVSVVRSRAEGLHGSASFDVVTSRAVAPLPRLLAWSMPLLAPAGRLLGLKGAQVREEVDRSRRELEAWETAEPVVRLAGAGVLDPPTTVLEVAWADPGRVGWPSRPMPSGAPSGARPRGGAPAQRSSPRRGRDRA
jgi:16S rRNA (guanine527-N7)-methyltransferase